MLPLSPSLIDRCLWILNSLHFDRFTLDLFGRRTADLPGDGQQAGKPALPELEGPKPVLTHINNASKQPTDRRQAAPRVGRRCGQQLDCIRPVHNKCVGMWHTQAYIECFGLWRGRCSTKRRGF